MATLEGVLKFLTSLLNFLITTITFHMTKQNKKNSSKKEELSKQD